MISRDTKVTSAQPWLGGGKDSHICMHTREVSHTKLCGIRESIHFLSLS